MMQTQLHAESENPLAPLQALVARLVEVELEKRLAAAGGVVPPQPPAPPAPPAEPPALPEADDGKKRRARPGENILWRGEWFYVARHSGSEEYPYYIRFPGKGDFKFKDPKWIDHFEKLSDARKVAQRLDHIFKTAFNHFATHPKDLLA